MNNNSRHDWTCLDNELDTQLVLHGETQIGAVLDRVFGRKHWYYDAGERRFVAIDPTYAGAGFGFYAIRPDGSWFKGVLHET